MVDRNKSNQNCERRCEMTIVFVFKNGFELRMKCTNFDASCNSITGRMVDFGADGVTENKPIDINYDELICVYREGGAE